MYLSHLQAQNFRNLSHIDIEFSPKCNIIYGQNGSGKTSLLEAIYYLILGKSFRSHLIRRIIKHDQDNLVLFGKIIQKNHLIPIGITKGINFGKRIKLAGNNITSIVDITKLLPLQLLNHNSYLLLYDVPKTRRQFIDWGLFHVEQSFLDLWRKFERVLEQRNNALRNKEPTESILAWDQSLSQLGNSLHNYRKNYAGNLSSILQTILSDLGCSFSVDISYHAGWNMAYDLFSALQKNLQKDLHFGYTTAGPHRADLYITINKIPAKDYLSRGQQKLLLYGLKIAQAVLLQQTNNKPCIYLIDDMLAELDTQKCELIANTLSALPQTQLFVTGLQRQPLEDLFSSKIAGKTTKLFSIQNGVIF